LNFTCISWQAGICVGALHVRYDDRVRFCIPLVPALLMADAKLREVVDEPKYFQKPNDHGNYDNAIEDSFDLSLHRNETVDKP